MPSDAARRRRRSQVRNHGVLAASARDHVVPAQREEAEATRSALTGSESIARPNGFADGGGAGERLVASASADVCRERCPSRAPPRAPANEIDREPVVEPMAFERTLAVMQSDPGFDFDPSPVEGPSPDDES